MKEKIILLKKTEVAEGTLACWFSKPTGFEYKAGQSIDLTLLNPPETDAKGNTRPYSLASAPCEDFLMIATRMRDTAFKRVLAKLSEGAELSLEGPFGNMVLHQDSSKPAVIVAGGIGITPFRSLLKQAASEKKPHQIFLFYSNRQPKDAVFLRELQSLEKENPNFKLIATMTQLKETENWSGEKDRLSREMIARYLPDLSQAIGYMAGPTEMVHAMHHLLNQAGIDDDRLRYEEFTGY